MATPLNVLIPIYTGFNTLDVNGPLDVICNYANREADGSSKFKITVTATTTDNVRAYEGISMVPDETFDTSLANIKAGKYDIVLVPGSGPGFTNKLIDNKDKILQVISAFVASDNAPGSRPKWLLSICTGGMLCGGAGVFKNLNVTSHFGVLDPTSKGGLLDICKAANAVPASITRQRWVDGGLVPPAAGQKVPTRVLSSGGISCGLDASLYFVQELYGNQRALAVAGMMDYNWNVTSNTPANPTW